jgi:uncharacterized protein YqjF (DUF2071 family)
MYQEWECLTFLHWRYEPDAVRRLLPAGLELELFDGSAWVGLVPFRILRLKPPRAFALPWISHFPETNVRTYVRGPGGETGVWFFSLDAARLGAVIGARLFYGLPYYWANMNVQCANGIAEYASRRTGGAKPAHARIRVSAGPRIAAGELERFLTARFRLYAMLRGKLAFADIEHEPWPLHQARTEHLEQTLIEAAGLPIPQGEPLTHYSPAVHVRVGPPHVIR